MARWYRAYEGTVTDTKLAEAALIAGVSRSVVIATWHAILESCATSNAGGAFETNSRRVAATLVEPITMIDQVWEALTELEMISDGCVTRWKARQYESDVSTSRVRAFREKKRVSETAIGGSSNAGRTLRNADETFQKRSETPPETDTDTEIVITPKGVTPNKVVEDAISGWNDLAAVAGLAGVQRLTEPRRRALKARLADAGGIEGWMAMLERVRDSSFLTGGNDRGWRADFDFVVKESNFTKIMEGKYDQREQLSAAQRACKRILSEEDDGIIDEIFQSLPFGQIGS